jgi:hypothetical protein
MAPPLEQRQAEVELEAAVVRAADHARQLKVGRNDQVEPGERVGRRVAADRRGSARIRFSERELLPAGESQDQLAPVEAERTPAFHEAGEVDLVGIEQDGVDRVCQL